MEMSRRDGAIVAWHEVPGTAPPQKSRPVGYGVIRAGVRFSVRKELSDPEKVFALEIILATDGVNRGPSASRIRAGVQIQNEMRP
jgi:hypothetical protein